MIEYNELVMQALPGSVNNNIITKTVINRLGEPYNQCIDDTQNLDSQLAKEIANMGSDYRRYVCYSLCKIHFIEEACQCDLSNRYKLEGNDTCNPDCVRSKDSFDYEKNCETCVQECDSVKYGLETNTYNLNGIEYYESQFEAVLKTPGSQFSNYSLEYVMNNLIHFTFGFKSMDFTEISESPKTTFTNLVAELGGTIGRNYFYVSF